MILHNELSDIKQKVQDTNLEVNKLKNILKSEVRIYLFLPWPKIAEFSRELLIGCS